MPRQTRVVKPQHEKSLRELLTQERNLADGLFGKAHQLFVTTDFRLGEKIGLHLGVGHGLTPSAASGRLKG